MEKEPIRFIGGPNDGQSVIPKEPIVPGLVMLGPANHRYTLKQFEVLNPKTGESETIACYVSDTLAPGEAERLVKKILHFRT